MSRNYCTHVQLS